jgi:hypothetical protein
MSIDARSRIKNAAAEAITYAPNIKICRTGDCFCDCNFDERVKYLLMVALRDEKPIS